MKRRQNKDIVEYYKLAGTIFQRRFKEIFKPLRVDVFAIHIGKSHRIYDTHSPHGRVASEREVAAALGISIPRRKRWSMFNGIRDTKDHHFETWIPEDSTAARRILCVCRFDKSSWDCFPATKMVPAWLHKPLSYLHYMFLITWTRCLRTLRREAFDHAWLTTAHTLSEQASSWYLSEWIETLTGGKDGFMFIHDVCDSLALRAYESSHTTGSIMFAKPDHHVKDYIRLKQPIAIRNIKAVRKMLQASQSGAPLLSDGNSVYGIAFRKTAYNYNNQDLLRVDFTGRHQWKVVSQSSVGAALTMYEVIDGAATMRPPRMAIKEFGAVLKGHWPWLNLGKIRKLWQTVGAALDSKHGALIIADVHSSAEADRLRGQGVAIVPAIPTAELIQGMVKIDGAILLDPNGLCHAFGVILDGQALASDGDAARGSRFNSASRYVAARAGAAIGFVISEDGYFDILPSRGSSQPGD